MRVAPAAAAARATFSGSMPPIANHGLRRARRRRSAIRLEPDGRAPGFVGVAYTGPTREVVGVATPRPRRPARASASRGPIEQVGADESRAPRDRHVVLADVHAVGAAGEREVGPVVHDEQRAVLVAQRRAAHAPARTSSSSRRVLVAQLHDVHAAAQRRRPTAAAAPASITR